MIHHSVLLMQQFISVEEARQIVLDAVAGPMPTERLPLAEALGRTLAETVVSRDAIPPFDNAAMDGFAVCTEDFTGSTATLEVVGEVAAGGVPTEAVRPETCVRIMTGAPVPDGADAVAPVEWVEADGAGWVRLGRAPTPGQHIRRAGEDVRPGDEMVARGTLVTPPVVGMAAALGYPTLAVSVPPRVAVVATGDELVDAGAVPGPGQIRDSNGPALAAQAAQAGGSVLGPRRARDEKDVARATFEHALEADVLLVSGGVSVGDYDIVKDVLGGLGVEWRFWKVRQRPGKPLAFGVRGGMLVFGLPGNPVSSAVCFEQYVRPALASLLGRHTVLRPRLPAVLAEPIPKAAGLHHFVRSIFEYGGDGRLRVRPTGPQGSGLYSSMLRADGLIHLTEAMEHPEAGTPVEVERLSAA